MYPYSHQGDLIPLELLMANPYAGLPGMGQPGTPTGLPLGSLPPPPIQQPALPQPGTQTGPALGDSWTDLLGGKSDKKDKDEDEDETDFWEVFSEALSNLMASQQGDIGSISGGYGGGMGLPSAPQSRQINRSILGDFLRGR